MKKTHEQVSATSIGAFKACPTRYRLAYVEGLRPLEETESQRVGTNWHKLLEIATMEPGTPCLCFGLHDKGLADPDCPICEGKGFIGEDSDPLERAVGWLNHKYGTVPGGKDRLTWMVERTILANSLAGWLWYYGEDRVHTLAREIKFDLPLRHPKTGRALPRVRRAGKIDRLVERDGCFMLGEYKSTTKSIDSGSSYWERLNLNTQISHYLCAAQELQQAGELEKYGLPPAGLNDSMVAGVLWDVWRKPLIRPKMLTQAETAAFMESGTYFGTQFEVEPESENSPIYVDGEPAEIVRGAEPKPTKKDPEPKQKFAIRETPDMFGARLLADIVADPGKFFVRREIARTAPELTAHAWETFHIYQTTRVMQRDGHWWRDESQCEATFRCPFTSICYNHQDVCDGKTTPCGFRRIFDIEGTVTEED